MFVSRMLVLFVFCCLAARGWSQQNSFYQQSHSEDALSSTSAIQQATPTGAQVKPASVRGSVVDRNGSGYAGIRVRLVVSGAADAATMDAATDSSGRYSFNSVAPGAFQITISANGFTTQVISGLVHPGESYEAAPVVLLLSTSVSQVQVIATQQEIALAQLKEEEKQRVFGVIPNFYVTYVPHAPALTSKQKFSLAWTSSIDPVTFAVVGVAAGVEQATDTFSGYGQGAQGFAKRYGAGYADTFIGTMIGGAILPSLLKQDPRYFYKGTGSTRSRLLYAISMSVVCRGDNGRWQPNYSGIIGGLAAGGISNLYYPARDRDGAGLTFENALIGIAGSAVQNVLQEFIVRKLTPKVPTYGSQ